MVETNQNTQVKLIIKFSLKVFFSLNVKSTYGIVLFFGTILLSSNTESKSFSRDELKCQTRSMALLWVGGVGTGREKRAYDMRGRVTSADGDVVERCSGTLHHPNLTSKETLFPESHLL